MTNWKYTIKGGTALREAIYNEDLEQVAKCLLFCYQELQNKLDTEDKQWYEDDIQDAIEELSEYNPDYEDEDEEYGNSELNHLLGEFYDLCDDLLAWIEI
jgi:hypothetical protein